MLDPLPCALQLQAALYVLTDTKGDREKRGEIVSSANRAFLSSQDGNTVFRFGNQTLRFQAPYSLERYAEVRQWDNGYLVVMAKYSHSDSPIEEYIDLIPILEKQSIDCAAFLSPIQEVEIL